MTDITTHTGGRGTVDGVNTGLTPQPRTGQVRERRSRGVENGAYTAFCARALAAAGRRVATGDLDGLTDLITLAAEVDHAMSVAVTGLHKFGYSWAQIADQLGITRQAAQQRWGGERP